MRRARHGARPARSSTTSIASQRILAELANDLDGGTGALDHVSGELRQQVMKLRMVPIARVFTKYHRTVRELAHALGKRARLELVGDDTELDKVLVEQLDDPLMHLVRNAVDHGIEPPEARARRRQARRGRHHARRAPPRQPDHRRDRATTAPASIPARLRDKAREKKLATDDELAAMDDTRRRSTSSSAPASRRRRGSPTSAGRGVGMDVVRDDHRHAS